MTFSYNAIVTTDGRFKQKLKPEQRQSVLNVTLEEIWKAVQRKIDSENGGKWTSAQWRPDRPLLAGMKNFDRHWGRAFGGFVKGGGTQNSIVAKKASRRGYGDRYKADLQAVHSHGAEIKAGAKMLYVPYSDRAYKTSASVAYEKFKAGSWVMGRIVKGEMRGYEKVDEDSEEETDRPIDFFFLPHVYLSSRSFRLTDDEIKQIKSNVMARLRSVRRAKIMLTTEY